MPRVYDLDHDHRLPREQLDALLGSKAANLNVMARELGLPVPPGFVVTTATCLQYLAHGWPEGLADEMRAHMCEVEARVGRRFGDPRDPLLVSVRSGAPVSMPGMMDTILNVGLTEAGVAGLTATTKDAVFARDCRTRLQAMYEETVGAPLPDDPWLQLRGAVEAVFRSWDSDRARAYRRREGIADDLGTGVVVQTMVFGNRDDDSATGVVFTRNPATGEPQLYGDVLFRAQGEDVVAGTHDPAPIAVLDERLPAVARELREIAGRLERHYADLCDIEFTIESGRLWLLQVRVGKRSPRAALRMAVDMAEDPTFPLTRADAVRRVAKYLVDPPLVEAPRGERPRPLTVGLPASPGVASGEIVVDPAAAEEAAAEGRAVILVRTETSPEDVRGMARAAGVLTAKGGLTSHAAVVARGWGIPAVVGAGAVRVGPTGIVIADQTLASGDTITIDGATGEVFAGLVRSNREPAPEVAILRGWARTLGIPLDEGPVLAGMAPSSAGASRSGHATSGDDAAAGASGDDHADDLVRTLLVKGRAAPQALAAALEVAPAQVSAALDRLAEGGIVEATTFGPRLTERGHARALALFAADQKRLGGAARAQELLERFLPLDSQLKAIVTAWQLRTVDGRTVANDHTDEAYDAALLEQLAGLHTLVAAWLEPLWTVLPRLHGYQDRLQRALDQARDGDRRFVASPLVESYHSIWFELHEELIRLSGKTRGEAGASAE